METAHDLSSDLVEIAQAGSGGPILSGPAPNFELMGLPPGDGPNVEPVGLRDALTKSGLESSGPLVQPISKVVNLAEIASSGCVELLEVTGVAKIADSFCAPRPSGPSEDLFLGAPGGDLGIASKPPSVPPPSGFKWQFITGLWSLVPLVVLVISVPSSSVPPDLEVHTRRLLPLGLWQMALLERILLEILLQGETSLK